MSISSNWPGLLKMRWAVGSGEDRHRRAAERGDAAELDRAGDPEVLLGPAGDHADRLADREVLLARGLGVDVDVGRARSASCPLASVSGLKCRPAGRVAEGQARRASPGDHLAVTADQAGLVGDRAGGE